MRAHRIKNVKRDNAGNVTIIHSNGTFHYHENDVVLKEWTNSFFCRFDIDYQSNWQKFIFWNWVLSISFGFFFLVIGMELSEIPIMNRSEGFSEMILIGMNRYYYILPLFLFTYIGFRWVYFIRYRDFFSKDLVFISLKSNQNILLKGERKGSVLSIFHYKDILQKILPNTENIRVFDDRKYNGEKLIGEYIAAILIFSITFCFIFSTWGDNSLSNPFPNAETYILKDLSKKELNKLTSAEQFEYEQKQLKSLKEYEIVSKKWNLKFANEQIPFYYFFSLGYILPVILGFTIFVGLSLLSIILLFLAYLLFWPVGYSIYKLSSKRDLNRMLYQKYIYPLISLFFITSLALNFYLTNDYVITLILFLMPILAPISFALIFGLLGAAVTGGDWILEMILLNLKEVFKSRYWRFLVIGKNEYPAEYYMGKQYFDPVIVIHIMIGVTWLIIFYHGFDKHIFNDGAPRTFIDKFIYGFILSVVGIRLLYRIISPFGLEFFFSKSLLNKIRNKRYLNFYKNDFLSIRSIVTQNGFMLEKATNRLKDNERIVSAAVKNNGLALQFASEDLKNDKEIVLEAIKSNKEAIQFASENLKNDPEILAFLNEANSEN
jgi:hypothetical protein